MLQLPKGHFFGETNSYLEMDGISLTDTIYTHKYVDWHYHEHMYFTFILQGEMQEGNKHGLHYCPAGTLLFHHWQDAHYNKKSEKFTRGFHIEIHTDWLKRYDVDLYDLEGALNIVTMEARLDMFRLFRESKYHPEEITYTIPALLLKIVSGINSKTKETLTKYPNWKTELDILLHDECTNPISFMSIAKTLGIHPVHLSKYFHKYFHCTMGEYVRKLKIERSLILLIAKKHTLGEIAHACGFADQSHFIRVFKQIMGYIPSDFNKVS